VFGLREPSLFRRKKRGSRKWKASPEAEIERLICNYGNKYVSELMVSIKEFLKEFVGFFKVNLYLTLTPANNEKVPF